MISRGPCFLSPRLFRPEKLRPDNEMLSEARKFVHQNYYYNVVSCIHIPVAPEMQGRSDLSYGHASMLLVGERSEATGPYNKYANLFK